jgi:hypothetical protein
MIQPACGAPLLRRQSAHADSWSAPPPVGGDDVYAHLLQMCGHHGQRDGLGDRACVRRPARSRRPVIARHAPTIPP